MKNSIGRKKLVGCSTAPLLSKSRWGRGYCLFSFLRSHLLVHSLTYFVTEKSPTPSTFKCKSLRPYIDQVRIDIIYESRKEKKQKKRAPHYIKGKVLLGLISPFQRQTLPESAGGEKD